MAQVSLQKITSAFKRGPESGAVERLTLEVRDREFVVLTGLAGCGASTVLRLIAGLAPLSGGEILIGSRPVQALPPGQRGVAMVFRNGGLFPQWSVAANIGFGLKGRHFPKAEIEKRVREAAEVTGMAGALECKPEDLTAAQRLRTALARAIIGQPKVILMEEPLAALGIGERAGMRAELVKLQDRLQTTLLYATGDPLEALALGHRVAVLHAGALQQFDTPAALYARPANLFVAGFAARPPMNLIAGRLRAAADGLLFKEAGGTVELKLPALPAWRELAGKDVVLGIRPEEIALVPAGEEKTRGVRCQGLVDYAEASGPDTFYWVQTGGHTVAIRSVAGGETGGQTGGAGRRVQFDIPPEKVHLFDAETTARLE